MDLALLAVIGIVALALVFDFTNGFHDAANSVGTVVATRAPHQWAPAFSAFFNFAALFIVGTAVANTVSKTVDKSHSSVGVIFAALFAAIAWNYITWFVGMPSRPATPSSAAWWAPASPLAAWRRSPGTVSRRRPCSS